jgi:hypothetical protein
MLLRTSADPHGRRHVYRRATYLDACRRFVVQTDIIVHGCLHNPRDAPHRRCSRLVRRARCIDGCRRVAVQSLKDVPQKVFRSPQLSAQRACNAPRRQQTTPIGDHMADAYVCVSMYQTTSPHETFPELCATLSQSDTRKPTHTKSCAAHIAQYSTLASYLALAISNCSAFKLEMSNLKALMLEAASAMLYITTNT